MFLKKRGPKVLLYIFLTIFVIQALLLFFLILTPNYASSADVEFTPQISIGDDFTAGQSQTVDNNTTGRYIKAIYDYGIGFIGILAAVILMFGGVIWLTAGGDQGKVTEAKEWIKAAIMGLILAMVSYIILLTINPDLISLKMPTIDEVKYIDTPVTNMDEAYLRNNRQTNNNISKLLKSTTPTRTLASNQKLDFSNYDLLFSEKMPNNLQRTFYVDINSGRLFEVHNNINKKFVGALEYELTPEAISDLEKNSNSSNPSQEINIDPSDLEGYR